MTRFSALRCGRALFAACVLTLGLVAGPLGAGHAGATFTTCGNCYTSTYTVSYVGQSQMIPN